MKHFILVSLSLCIILSVSAQVYTHKQYDRIQHALRSGTEFKQWELFVETPYKPVPNIAKSTTYKSKVQDIKRLYQKRDKAISVVIGTATGKSYRLQMVRSHPFAHHADIGYIDGEGRHRADSATGIHYQGIIAGTEQSVATMSIFPDGHISVFFSNAEGNFSMTKHTDVDNLYALFNSNDVLSKPAFTCTVKEEDVPGTKSNSSNKTTATTPECKKVRVYWEISYEFYVKNVNMTNAQNYAATLFNMMQGIYYNDGFIIEMSAMYIWTIPDPYKGLSPQAQFTLTDFTNYWNILKNSFGADMAMYIGQTGSYGYANIQKLCLNDPFAALHVNSYYNDLTFQFRDMYVICHEAGHVFGARHTHSCLWNTGPNGTCGAIDNCSTLEDAGGTTCPNCPYIHDVYNNQQSWAASFMTYCTGYVNFSVGFGPYIRDYIGNVINNLPCLQSIVQPQLSATTVCDSNGIINLSFATNNYGVPPYSYLWSTGDTTQNIQNLDTPGRYTVVITDSNQCNTKAEVMVNKRPRPGDAQPLPQKMPLCCKDTSYSVTITASLPEGMDACRTVGWLRSSSPVTSYQQFETLFALAGPNDLSESDNSTIIDNTHAAKLSVKTPDSCKATTIDYYTPFTIRRARSSMVITNNGIDPRVIWYGYPQVGNSDMIGDTTVAVLDCNPAVVPDSCIITVGVSNYTGRANHMVMRIIDAGNNELFYATNYPGNGTYRIPISKSVNPLQKMYVFVMDINCSPTFVCDTVTCSLQVKREVYYPAVPAMQLDSACYVGKSVLLSFGPDSCETNNVDDAEKNTRDMSVYPNPAHGTATLCYHSPVPGTGKVSLVAVEGKVVSSTSIHYLQGKNQHLFDLRKLVKGIYFIRFEDHTGEIYSLKLSVQ